METLTMREFNKLVIKTEREQGSLYRVRLFDQDNDDTPLYSLQYNLGNESVSAASIDFSEEQLCIIHDEVAEQFANDQAEDRMYEHPSITQGYY